MREQIQALAQEFFSDVVQYRRHLHAYPELSFQEVETSRFVAGLLSEWGIPYTSGIAGNGIVGIIRGKRPGKRVIALRADMDALPILEANDVPYKSKNEGVMHACGHDVHTASLLGAVRILHNLRDRFSGTVKLIFQPGEERLPGGASLMIREGALKRPKPDGIFGQHVHPPLPAGIVGFRPGRYMASADEIYATIKGRGGHGALPHQCIDPIAIAAQMIVALQQIVSRYSDPITPSVLTFGKINSTGGATNVIPGEVRIEGTFRTMDEPWRVEAHKRMKRIAEDLARSMGGACEFSIVKGYPVLHNDAQLTQNARQWAEEYLGPDRVADLPIRLTAEDFAFYSQQIPACFYRLGTGNPQRGITSAVHTDMFDIDETALITGMGLMAWLAVKHNVLPQGGISKPLQEG